MARICIYGAGLVGCYLGGRLLAAGGDIRFIGRPAIGDVLRRDGLTVSHYDGRSWHVPPEAIVFGTDAAIAKATADVQDAQAKEAAAKNLQNLHWEQTKACMDNNSDAALAVLKEIRTQELAAKKAANEADIAAREKALGV